MTELPEQPLISLLGDGAIIRGPAAQLLAACLERVDLDAVAMRSGLGPKAALALRSAAAVLEEAGDRWADISRRRNGETAAAASSAGSEASWISTAQAAHVLGLSVRRVQQLAAAGKLESQRIGRGLVISRASALALRDAA